MSGFRMSLAGEIWSKGWARITIVAVAVVLFLVFVLPLFVNANTFRPVLESQLSHALGRKVTIGNLRFSVLAGGLRAKDISVADDPAFSSQPFLKAKALRVKVEVWSLLFHHQLIVDGLTIQSPSIRLISNGSGTWNFSSIGRTAASGTSDGESAIPSLTIGVFKIRDGDAAISTLGSSAAPIKLRRIRLDVRQFSFLKSFPFEFTAAVGSKGEISIAGTAGPVSRKDTSDTPFSVKIQFKNFDPVKDGFLAPDDGLDMVADIGAQAQSDGTTLTSSGEIQAARLKLVKTGRPAPREVDITYSVDHNLNGRTGRIDRLDVKTGGIAAHCNGTYQLTKQQAVVALNISVPRVPVNQVEALLPAVGVDLPGGSKLEGGTITATLTASGPLSALTIRGPVEIDNTRLAGFDLGSKISGLKPVRGSGGGTEIRVLRAQINSSASVTGIDNLYIDVPALGTATGSGTVSPSGALNFHVLARLNPSTGAASQALAGLESSHGALGQIIDTAAQKGIPLIVTGTTTNPHIQADLSQLIRKNVRGILEQQLEQNLGRGSRKPGGKKPDAGSILNQIFGGR